MSGVYTKVETETVAHNF
uniref:Uncharacterized protein n=1 Tax=Anguilla anguilla TaxID=7936 RepID=A0A0E9RR76_ANGAN